MNYSDLWAMVAKQFPLGIESLHGPEHWQRVLSWGLSISRQNCANEWVVRLFALFHDCRRTTDWLDLDHGKEGAKYAASCCEAGLFVVSEEQWALLSEALTLHPHELTSNDPTIGACFDADRLDLTRCGIEPEAKYMSTDFGLDMCSR